MSEKMTCPVCDAHTSSVLAAVVVRGEPCPYCGTPADTILNIEGLRHRHQESELRTQVERLMVELGKVTAERDRYKRVLVEIEPLWTMAQAAMDGKDPDA